MRRQSCEGKLPKLEMLFPTMTLFVPLVILVESVSVGAVVDSRWKGASSSYSSVRVNMEWIILVDYLKNRTM